MDVYEAVTSRRAVRGFMDRPVSREVLERVLSAAAWSPSGSNIQPWHVYVLTGEPLAELKKRAGARAVARDPWDEPEYQMYPPELKSPYRERRSDFGEKRYGALGISREDWDARRKAATENWECFGAPAALFCYIDRDMGQPQWSDVGIYLQTVMLLLRAEGLHSCAQMAWSVYRRTVAEIVSPPDGLILYCGMSIGYADPTIDHARTGRAPLEETVTFIDRQHNTTSGIPRADPARDRLVDHHPPSNHDAATTHQPHLIHLGFQGTNISIEGDNHEDLGYRHRAHRFAGRARPDRSRTRRHRVFPLDGPGSAHRRDPELIITSSQSDRGWDETWEEIEPNAVNSLIPNDRGRFGRPEEIAAAVAYLCSDYAEYISGATIRVDGGLIKGAF